MKSIILIILKHFILFKNKRLKKKKKIYNKGKL
jgi:hypothetical protein